MDVEWLPHNNPKRIDYMEKIGNLMSLKEMTLENIFKTEYFSKISELWHCDAITICKQQCGTIDSMNEQFK